MFYYDDPMDVIGHDDEMIIVDMWEMIRYLMPGCFHDHANGTQLHITSHHPAEDTGMLVCDDGHEIRPGLGIIVIWQADGPPVM